MFFRRRPDPTRQLDISDLRPANEFDVMLLEDEGVQYDGVTVRGASVVPAPMLVASRDGRTKANEAAPPLGCRNGGDRG